MAAPADAADEHGLFAGLKFFLLQRIPMRSHYVNAIRNNGGTVVKLEAQANHVIADHARKDVPNGSLSWRFIDESLKQGFLAEATSYTISSASGAARPAGSVEIASKKTRTEYTPAEDLAVRRYVYERTKGQSDGRGQGGNTIYMDYAKDHPGHTWQSLRDRYLKKLKHLGPPAEKSTETVPEPESLANDIATRPRSSMIPGSPARTQSSSVAPSPRNRIRIPFTLEEDTDLYNYVCSKPPNKRHGNEIYRQYAETHPRHPEQAWRSRYIDKLERSTIASADPGDSIVESDVDTSRRRIPFTLEEDWALWTFVQEKGGPTSGNAMYKDFAQRNPSHPWQSWRHRYVKILSINPPARVVLGAQQTERSEAVSATSVAHDPDDNVLLSRQAETSGSHAGNVLSSRQAGTSGSQAGTALSPRQAEASASHDDTVLSSGQQALLAAILGRKPRDSVGAYYTELEISHLILNMPDLITKTVHDEQLEMWEEWTKVMQSRSAQDWKDLYYDHIYPEAVRLGHDRIASAPRSNPVQAGNQSAVPDAAAAGRKRKASTPLQDSPTKKPRQGRLSDDESSKSFSEQCSPQRSERDQLHGSVVRRESIFEQAVHKRQAEESMRQSLSELTRGDALTTARLAAQTQNQRVLTARPVHASSAQQIATMRTREKTSSAPQQSRNKQSSNLFCTPRPIDDIPQDKYVDDAEMNRSNTHNVNASQIEPTVIVSNTDSSLNLYDASVPPQPHIGPSEHDETPRPPESQIHASDVLYTALLDQSKSQEHSVDSAELGFAYDIPSPAGSHITVSEELVVPAKTEAADQLSMGSLPGSHLAKHLFSDQASVLQDQDDSHEHEHEHGPSRNRRDSGSSSAFETRESTPINRPRIAKLDTQAILDLESQVIDYTLALPDSALSRSPTPIELLQSPTNRIDASGKEVTDNPGDVDAFLLPYVECFGSDEVGHALDEASGRPVLAASILDSKKQNRVYQPDAMWRWTTDEDDIVRGSDARKLKALEDKHGTHELKVRLMYLDREFSSQE